MAPARYLITLTTNVAPSGIWSAVSVADVKEDDYSCLCNMLPPTPTCIPMARFPYVLSGYPLALDSTKKLMYTLTKGPSDYALVTSKVGSGPPSMMGTCRLQYSRSLPSGVLAFDSADSQLYLVAPNGSTSLAVFKLDNVLCKVQALPAWSLPFPRYSYKAMPIAVHAGTFYMFALIGPQRLPLLVFTLSPTPSLQVIETPVKFTGMWGLRQGIWFDPIARLVWATAVENFSIKGVASFEPVKGGAQKFYRLPDLVNFGAAVYVPRTSATQNQTFLTTSDKSVAGQISETLWDVSTGITKWHAQRQPVNCADFPTAPVINYQTIVTP